MTILLALSLAGAAALVSWPRRNRRRLPVAQPASDVTATIPRDLTALRSLVALLTVDHPRSVAGSAIAAVAGVALLAGGPVAAVVGATYAALGARALLRHAAGKRAEAQRSAALDNLAALAADLRAGLVVTAARVPTDGEAERLAGLTAAAWRLAEATGAPAADLIERIEADARDAARATQAAAAQAAGAQVTALLLAGLPLAGIGLGIAIGADPLPVLLHTPLGAACAIGAAALQTGGLLWADRLAGGAGRPSAGRTR